MSNSEGFERLVSRLPISKDRLLGMGLRYFLEKQNPEEVNLRTYKNGWAIEVKTDEEHIDEALEFWEKNVEDKV